MLKVLLGGRAGFLAHRHAPGRVRIVLHDCKEENGSLSGEQKT